MQLDSKITPGDTPLYLVNAVDGTELVLVPGGWFWMGSGDEDSEAFASEKPRHLHWVAPFYLSIACITVAQFRRFVKETNHDVIPRGESHMLDPVREDPDEHPVRYMNWDNATAYCEWAGLRLPTEAEWELAARSYGALTYPWGADWEDGRRVCWYGQKRPQGSTAAVFAHPEGVSRFGSFQQSGNLWEWCLDAYDYKTYERYTQSNFSIPKRNPTRILRGGSCSYDDRSHPEFFRGAHRNSQYPGQFVGGIRAAKTIIF